MSRILVTGGAGFIGSHTSLVLLQAGYKVFVLDNFSNSSPVALDRIGLLSNIKPSEFDGDYDSRPFLWLNGDVRDSDCLDYIFSPHSDSVSPFAAVIHFAGLKSVNESIADPLLYWDVNVMGSHALFKAMSAYGCNKIVFSSTSTVYGEPVIFPLTESTFANPIHPYSHSKLAVEQILNALTISFSWKVASLRYFNPVGAHPSGFIGEDPLGIPNNLFPFITQIASGRLKKLLIFGDDYPTSDGTGIRDYLHVMDLAEAHASAVNYLLQVKAPTNLTLNLGTGKGLSVLDVVSGFQEATGITIPYEFVERRPGDVPKLQACPKKAEAVLGWTARRSLAEMCRDGWAWQSANPNGYRGAT